MLTRVVALLLLLCSVSLNLSGCFVLAGFEMNQDYIAKELCINRNKPQLHCNGRCYLMRKLKQAQDKEQKQEHSFQKIQLQQPVAAISPKFKQFSIPALQITVPLCTGMPVSQGNSVFHPPQFFCSSKEILV